MSHSVAVLVSGSGTNLQALIDAQQAGKLPVEFSVVLSNKADAYALKRAQAAGIPTLVVEHQDYPSREAFDEAMIQALAPYTIDTLVLAGFMRILTPIFVRHFHQRLLNVHPSLLPLYRGLNTHQRALDNQDKTHGCSIHFVSDELDGGPLVAQAIVPVHPSDTEASLAERVHQSEHLLYPKVLLWRAQRQLTLTDKGVTLNGKPLPPQGYSFFFQENSGELEPLTTDLSNRRSS